MYINIQKVKGTKSFITNHYKFFCKVYPNWISIPTYIEAYPTKRVKLMASLSALMMYTHALIKATLINVS